MPKAALYTVANPGKEAASAQIGIRKEPIDAGLSKEMPISLDTALDLVGQGFKVTGPDGKAVKRETKPKE
jgi:hypothetical protein